MTDHDVDREIEANEQRKVDQESADEDALTNVAERVVNPIVDLIDEDAPDADEAERQRRENDAEQR